MTPKEDKNYDKQDIEKALAKLKEEYKEVELLELKVTDREQIKDLEVRRREILSKIDYLLKLD